jgi:hypothetical protein
MSLLGGTLAVANVKSIPAQEHLREFFLHSVRWIELTSDIFGRWPKELQRPLP